jgi:hypothetical protein
MAGLATRMLFEPQKTLGFADIGAAYMGVGTALEHPIRQFLIVNNTNAALQFSFDGLNDHFIIPANGYFLNDITSNRSVSQAFFLAEGDRLYAKQLGDAPTDGSVYFTAMYGKE